MDFKDHGGFELCATFLKGGIVAGSVSVCKFVVTDDKSRSSLLDFSESVDVYLFVWIPNATGVL